MNTVFCLTKSLMCIYIERELVNSMTRCLTDSPAPVVMTMGTPGQCVHFCATNAKAWSVKCKWENRCDSCAECAGGCFSFERVIDVHIEGL